MILYWFAPSDMSFQTILMPKVILAIFLSQKTGLLEPFLSLVRFSMCTEFILRLIFCEMSPLNASC